MNWKITQIKTLNNPLEGTVVNASYSVTDGVSTIESDVNLLPANADSFTELSTITEEQVIQWVKDALNATNIEGDISGVEKIEALVSLKTNEPKPQITPLPWEL
jgi:hypothetical protein